MTLFKITRRVAVVALVLGAPLPVVAQTYTSDGHDYRFERNANGAVLTSVNPVTRMVGQGAASRFVTDTEVLYLGKECDAYSEMFGTGSWAWANGGFVIEFESKRFGFPRQEISVTDDLSCRM